MLMEELEPGTKVSCRGFTWTVKYKNIDSHTVCLHKPRPAKGALPCVTVSLSEVLPEQPKVRRDFVRKYPWSDALLERFKKELVSQLKPDEETPFATIMVAMGVWTQEDADREAMYDNQRRIFRDAMYWLCDHGTLVASAGRGYMLPVSEEAKERCRASVVQRQSKSML